ncbi:MAG: LamG domain-containing protein, partial [archaeon]|nr:LamG domain-containing protein [archaeon]
EATVSPASLTFTKDNWNTAQTVTLTGVDDNDSDRDQAFRISLYAEDHSNSNSHSKAVTAEGVLNEGWRTHIVATYDGTDLKLYINGELEATESTDENYLFSEGTDIWIGDNTNAGSGTTPFDGYIDEVSIWETALTIEEINEIMNADDRRSSARRGINMSSPAYGKNLENLVLHYSFEGDSYYSSMVRDASGKENHGERKGGELRTTSGQNTPRNGYCGWKKTALKGPENDLYLYCRLGKVLCPGDTGLGGKYVPETIIGCHGLLPANEVACFGLSQERCESFTDDSGNSLCEYIEDRYNNCGGDMIECPDYSEFSGQWVRTEGADGYENCGRDMVVCPDYTREAGYRMEKAVCEDADPEWMCLRNCGGFSNVECPEGFERAGESPERPITESWQESVVYFDTPEISYGESLDYCGRQYVACSEFRKGAKTPGSPNPKLALREAEEWDTPAYSEMPDKLSTPEISIGLNALFLSGLTRGELSSDSYSCTPIPYTSCKNRGYSGTGGEGESPALPDGDDPGTGDGDEPGSTPGTVNTWENGFDEGGVTGFITGTGLGGSAAGVSDSSGFDDLGSRGNVGTPTSTDCERISVESCETFGDCVLVSESPAACSSLPKSACETSYFVKKVCTVTKDCSAGYFCNLGAGGSRYCEKYLNIETSANLNIETSAIQPYEDDLTKPLCRLELGLNLEDGIESADYICQQEAESSSLGLEGRWIAALSYKENDVENDLKGRVRAETAKNVYGESITHVSLRDTFGTAYKWLEDDVLSLDGNSGYVQIPDSATIESSTTITATGWFWLEGLQPGYRVILSKSSNGNNRKINYELAINSNDELQLSASGRVIGTTETVTSSFDISADKWYYFTFVVSPQRMKLYVSDASEWDYYKPDRYGIDTSSSWPFGTPITAGAGETITATLSTNDEDLYIGAMKSGSTTSNHFKGMIDSITIWTTELGPTQYYMLQKLGRGGVGGISKNPYYSFYSYDGALNDDAEEIFEYYGAYTNGLWGWTDYTENLGAIYEFGGWIAGTVQDRSSTSSGNNGNYYGGATLGYKSSRTFSYDEDGTYISDNEFWTGTDSSGGYSGEACEQLLLDTSWTGTLGTYGTYGKADELYVSSTFSKSDASCSDNLRLACLKQDYTPDEIYKVPAGCGNIIGDCSGVAGQSEIDTDKLMKRVKAGSAGTFDSGRRDRVYLSNYIDNCPTEIQCPSNSGNSGNWADDVNADCGDFTYTCPSGTLCAGDTLTSTTYYYGKMTVSTGPCGGCDLGNGYCKSRFSDDCVSFIVGGELDPCDSSETSGGIIIGADTGDFSGDFGLGGGGSSSSSSSGGTFTPKTTDDSCSLFGTGSGGGLGGGGGGTSGGSGEDNVIDGSGGLDGFS